MHGGLQTAATPAEVSFSNDPAVCSWGPRTRQILVMDYLTLPLDLKFLCVGGRKVP